MTAIQTKVRNRVELQDVLNVCVSNTEPRFEKLVPRGSRPTLWELLGVDDVDVLLQEETVYSNTLLWRK